MNTIAKRAAILVGPLVVGIAAIGKAFGLIVASMQPLLCFAASFKAFPTKWSPGPGLTTTAPITVIDSHCHIDMPEDA